MSSLSHVSKSSFFSKHNPPEDKALFTFSRVYRLHQVTVRSLEGDKEKSSVAAFCISAFAQPPDMDLVVYAANARDKVCGGGGCCCCCC